MSLKEKLDIFIITYNRDESLDETLKELLSDKSPIKDFEIKIIDNNSSDNTAQVVEKWMKKYPNIKYSKNKYNIGGNANIMKAFYEAEKEYVWILADNDYYCWDSWNEVEKAIEMNCDAIFVSNYGCPELSIAQLYNQATFLPGVIYKTSNLNDTIMGNMAFNISNMFPHNAVMASIINKDGNIYIIQKEIVHIGDNRDKKTGKHIYTRGYNDEIIHPYLKQMSWLTGYANTILLLKDKKIRNICLSEDKFALPFVSGRVFEYNKVHSFNSLYNLLCIFCALNKKLKFKFIMHFLLHHTLYKIYYKYETITKPNENNEIITKKIVRFFGKSKVIKTTRKIRKNFDSTKFYPVSKGV